MKNIHVLPTDKPSRLLYFGTSKELTLQVNPATFRVFERSTQNIYITSDEEIKEGDYYISILENEVYKATKETQNIMSVANLIGTTSYKKTHFKIILTTDQDLIKNGVQAIDDEFLQWFVKNPSCEEVEVEKFFGFAEDYLIIIPKEEPKQETLEEAAERFYPEIEQWTDRHIFNLGAKWQQEQDKNKYSEEDLRTAYFSGIKTTGEGWNGEYANGNNPSIEEEFQEGFQEWLRQFKNK